jgi:hypothetical protein
MMERDSQQFHRARWEAVMVDIVLTPEQVAAIKTSRGTIRFVSADGDVRATVHSVEAPVDWESLSEEVRAELVRRIQTMDGNLITTEELLDRLNRRFPA